jgi:hypothetical protein
VNSVKNPLKANRDDFPGRFREVISDPLNLLIEKVPLAGVLEGNDVYLHNGHRVPVAGEGAYYGSFSNLLVLNRGVHEPLEEYVFQELLKQLPIAPSMIELGAYWGHYSMWLLKLRPQALVIMVEPDKANLLAGMQNFERNGYVGYAAEFIRALVGRGHFGVDAFLQSRSQDKRLQHLDVLHVDIQGFEAEMLEGCHNTLTNLVVDYVFISTHSQQLHQQMIAELGRHGYRVEVSSDFDNETTSYDGFLFASSPRMKPLFTNFDAPGRTTINSSRPADLLQGLLRICKPSG